MWVKFLFQGNNSNTKVATLWIEPTTFRISKLMPWPLGLHTHNTHKSSYCIQFTNTGMTGTTQTFEPCMEILLGQERNPQEDCPNLTNRSWIAQFHNNLTPLDKTRTVEHLLPHLLPGTHWCYSWVGCFPSWHQIPWNNTKCLEWELNLQPNYHQCPHRFAMLLYTHTHPSILLYVYIHM